MSKKNLSENFGSNQNGARRLTAKQKAFISWYVSADVNCNATEAARRAGYKGNENTLGTVGFQNMQKPAIRAEIDRRLKEALTNTEITIESVLIDLQRIGKKAEAAGHYAAALNAAHQRGKYLGMFSNRIEKVRPIEEISDAELLERIRETAKELGIDPEPIISGYIAKGGLNPDAK